MARKKKKRRLKMSRVLLVLGFLAVLGYGIYLLSQMPVRGFYIVGNTYYTDNEILEKTKLDRYPSYLFTDSINVSMKVRKDKLIKKIKIKHKINGMFEVIVYENKIMLYDEIKKKSILKDGTEVDKKIYHKLLIKMEKLNDNIVKNVSEIKDGPNDLDKERFLFSMNDGNYVYATLTKFANINKYLEISNTLGQRKGILYLDYGNYFVPKE